MRGRPPSPPGRRETLTATEDKIEFSRRFYNGNVRDYNIKLQTLPTSLIAGALGFKAFGFFQADEADRAVPQVSFGNTAQGGPSGPGSLPPWARRDLHPRASHQLTSSSRSQTETSTRTPPARPAFRCPARG